MVSECQRNKTNDRAVFHDLSWNMDFGLDNDEENGLDRGKQVERIEGGEELVEMLMVKVGQDASESQQYKETGVF